MEDYQVAFNFSPTAVQVGDISLTTTPVDDYLEELTVGQMSDEALFQLLSSMRPEAPDRLQSASRTEILNSLREYLDPDNDGKVVVFRWETLEERGTIGFHVERKDESTDWKQINSSMLPGLITAPMGGDYIMVDPTAKPGVPYYYKLIEVEATGNQNSYGPFQLQAE